jgi:hypothetical protein
MPISQRHHTTPVGCRAPIHLARLHAQQPQTGSHPCPLSRTGQRKPHDERRSAQRSAQVMITARLGAETLDLESLVARGQACLRLAAENG